MKYVLDTVTFIRFLTKNQNIGKSAKQILISDENKFFISIITFMEILYLSEKNRIPISLYKAIEYTNLLDTFEVVDLNTNILLTAKEIAFYELHDRMILATAKYLNIPIISSDKKFQNISDIEVIWN